MLLVPRPEGRTSLGVVLPHCPGGFGAELPGSQPPAQEAQRLDTPVGGAGSSMAAGAGHQCRAVTAALPVPNCCLPAPTRRSPASHTSASVRCSTPNSVPTVRNHQRPRANIARLMAVGRPPTSCSRPSRDAEAAKRFVRKALGQPQTVNPRTIAVDKNAAYPCAIEQLKEDGELWRRSRLQ